VSTLYLIAPPCLLFLTIPFAFLEAPRMMNDPNIGFHPWLLLGSAAAAFGELVTSDVQLWDVQGQAT
jgi:hypothetical protein